MKTTNSSNKTTADKLALIIRAVERAIEGIIITDVREPDNGIIFANQSFYKLTGYGPDDILGKNCRFLQGPDTDKATIHELKNCIAERRVFEKELLNYKKSGEPFWNYLTVIPMFDEAGTVTHFAGFQNDVTKRKEAEAAAMMANKELEAFNYTVSHDLQGPLRTMSSFSKMLLKNYGPKLDEDARQQLEFIEQSAKQMSELVKDLLAFSQQGTADLKLKAVDLDAEVGHVVAELKLNDKYFKGTITQHPLGDALCDAALMKQVWVNLIGNATKYSSKKALPAIEVGKYSAGTETVYYIKDNGAGFDMEKSKDIFSPFHRMHLSSEFEGSGVGLATVHRIITRHGGRIWADARPGEGATFYFTLKEA